MNILAITARADIGGGPEHLFQLTRGYGTRARVTIACPADKPYSDRYETLANVHRVVEIPHRAFTFAALRRLKNIVREDEIHVIHSHGKGAGLYGRLLAAWTGTPCIHTFHGLHVGDYGRAKRAAYLGLERVLGWATQVAICVSEGEAAQIRATGILPTRKLKTVPNGVVVPEELLAPSDDHDVLKIVAVNRYDQQKNPMQLIEIARHLRDRIGNKFQITVLGQGEQFQDVARAVKEADLTSLVLLAGPTNTPRDVFRQNAYFLSTSLWEGMPLAVLEAMSEGLVPILSDVVGNRDVIENGETGFLFDVKHPIGAVDALLRAQQARATVRSATYQSVRDRFSVEQMAEETLRITRSVL